MVLAPSAVPGFQGVWTEKVTERFANLEVEFEPKNPVTALINQKTGKFKDAEIKNERMLSVTIEMVAPQEILSEIIDALQEVENVIETMMTVGLITTSENSEIPILSNLHERGIRTQINGKVNLGLGLAWSYK